MEQNEKAILNLILTKLNVVDDGIKDLQQGQQRLEARMDRLEEKVDRLEARMDRLEEKVDRLEVRMDSLEEKVDRLEARMDSLEEKVDRLEERVGSLETEVSSIKWHITDNNVAIAEIFTKALEDADRKITDVKKVVEMSLVK